MDNARKKPDPLFITIPHIMKAKQCERSAASKTMRAMRDIFKKERHQQVTVMECALYLDVDMEELLKRIR